VKPLDLRHPGTNRSPVTSVRGCLALALASRLLKEQPAMFFCVAVVLLSVAALGEAKGLSLAPHLLLGIWGLCTLYVLHIMARGILGRRLWGRPRPTLLDASPSAHGIRATIAVIRQRVLARGAMGSVGVRP
jgi:hypothetical protein